MIPEAAPILTTAEMRDAEAAAVSAGASWRDLMERAGGAVAALAARIGAGRPITVLAGPGNNGGDGYVAAQRLRDAGAQVRLVALEPPRTELARAVAADFGGDVEGADAAPAPHALIVDALFGTGFRGDSPAAYTDLLRLFGEAGWRMLAVDVPSGVDAETGRGGGVTADVTLALGALKPAHLLQPSASRCGSVVAGDIGVTAQSRTTVAQSFAASEPSPESHKYSRGLVVVVAGDMPGAAELAARAAMRGGAGYVRLMGSRLPPVAPFALVRSARIDAASLADPRIGAVVVGCGLGQSDSARERLELALASPAPVVADADAIALMGHRLHRAAIITPHAGEFARAFPDLGSTDKLTAAREAAARSRTVVVYKGADTVIAAPDGRAAIAPPAPGWLASAGTGDVLAGLCGAALASGLAPFEAAQAAVMRHAELARRAGTHLVADDLVR